MSYKRFSRQSSKVARNGFSGAFSFIELVFVIAVCGVLLMVVPKQLDFGKKSCYIKLANTLNTIQEQLSFLYARHALLGSAPDPAAVQVLIQAHSLESNTCSLVFVRNRFRANVLGQSVNFTLEPSDFSVQPAFKCAFSSNLICREILLRSKKM